jgi:hypothetical protein
MMKIWQAHIHVLSAYAKVLRKNDISCASCKEDKKSRVKSPILAPKFVFLHRTHKMSMFHETTL